ncbi:MAG TPA: hypothetical protein VMV79_02875 [Alphaproteobacteria bacterium]|jgi:hypothetical protein|nr:hypothetical protein [Alphaproteobacteria bacterium]
MTALARDYNRPFSPSHRPSRNYQALNQPAAPSLSDSVSGFLDGIAGISLSLGGIAEAAGPQAPANAPQAPAPAAHRMAPARPRPRMWAGLVADGPVMM